MKTILATLLMALTTLTLNAQLSGTYTIGATGDYASIAAATNDLNTVGVSGSVEFNILTGTYNEAINLSNIPGSSELNAVTFRSSALDRDSVKLRVNSSSLFGTVHMDDAGYVTVEHLTLERYDDGGNEGKAVVLNNGTHHITIDNCRIIGIEIFSDIQSMNVIYTESESGVNPAINNIVISNNKILKGNIGLSITGTDVAEAITVKGNSFSEQFFAGAWLDNTKNCNISGNEILVPVDGNGERYGFYVENSIANGSPFTIQKNKIYNTSKVASVKYSAITINQCNGNSLGKFLIANNFIQLDGNNNMHGVDIDQSHYISMIHNTIKVKSTSVDLGSPMKLDKQAQSSSNIEILNNIFYNSTGRPAIWVFDQNVIVNSDYNDFYTEGGDIAYEGTKGWLSALGNWQAETGFDLNSVTLDPMFVADLDPHVTNSLLDGKGYFYSAVPSDIDNDLRSITKPDIGADEFLLGVLGNDTLVFYGDTIILDAGIYGMDYQWEPNGETTQTIQVTEGGTYIVHVRDAFGELIGSDTVVINFELYLELGGDTLVFFGDTITLDAGVLGMQYLWKPSGETTQTIQVTEGGVYIVHIRNTYGELLGADTIEITLNPELIVDLTSTQASCEEICNGTVKVAASGGAPPYTYIWTDMQTADSISTCAGAISVTVTDNVNCFIVKEIEVGIDPNQMLITTDIYNSNCETGDGAIAVTMTGGTPPYIYLWSTGADGDSIANLFAGTYILTVTDAKGCPKELSIIVEDLNAPEITFFGKKLSCYGTNDGSATVDASGGASPYTYLWSDSLSQTTEAIYDLAAGEYSVTVTDNLNCKAIKTIMIQQPDPLMALINSYKHVKCCAYCDANATVTVTGGTVPYTYYWSNEQTMEQAVDLCAGHYGVTVMDLNNCIDSTSITITEPDSIIITCSITSANYGLCDGTICVSVEDGNSPYCCSWGNGYIGDTITDMCAGVYEVIITDADSCSVTKAFEVDEMASSVVQGGILTSISAITDSMLMVELYQVSDTSKMKLYTSAYVVDGLNFSLINIIGGTYILKVKVLDSLLSKQLSSTYYGDEHYWENADVIIIGSEDTITIDVAMFELPEIIEGEADIAGTLTYAGNGNAKFTRLVGEPVPGADIYIEENEAPVSYTVSDAYGWYQTEKLPINKTYTFRIDIPGIPMRSTHTITLTKADTTYGGLNFVVDTTAGNEGIYAVAGTTAISTKDNDFILELYPNPFKYELNIYYKLINHELVTVEIYDQLNRKVVTIINEQQQVGEYNYIIDRNQYSLKSGNYFLKVQVGEQAFVRKIILLE